jgi:tetratricopeptide (TPR) repeat protein
MTRDDLDRLLAPLSDEGVGARRAAAKTVIELGGDAVPAITAKLAELRKGGAGTAAYNAMKGLKERSDSGDPFEGLLTQKPDAGSKVALSYLCLVRALAHVGTTAAVRQMVLVASDAGGVFRPELTRLVKGLGDRAVAALIEARRDPSRETRVWAGNTLDTMGKRLPGDAVQTKNNQALADILRAYGAVKDLDAMPVVISFVDSDRAQVRAAAREALGAYGQDAIWKLREAFVNLTGKPAPEGSNARDLAKELFAAYDKARLQEVYELLDEGLAKEKEGKLEEAVQAFDKVLARQPMLDRRGEMVRAYVAYAQTLEEKDRAGALAYLRKASRLDENGPDAAKIESAIRYLEGEELLGRGIADVDVFKSAVALDPDNTRAKAELARLESDSASRQQRLRRYAAGGAVFALAIAGIFWVGGRRRRPAKPEGADLQA